jgi:hypothetical protein
VDSNFPETIMGQRPNRRPRLPAIPSRASTLGKQGYGIFLVADAVRDAVAVSLL